MPQLTNHAQTVEAIGQDQNVDSLFNSQMMHQIVNSNEELIQEQLKDIKQLIIENSSLKEKIKTLEGKYSILLECSKGKVQETLIQQKNSHQSHPASPIGKLEDADHHGSLMVDSMADKIIQLQNLLLQSKLELALKSQQLLGVQFNYRAKEGKQISRINRQNIDKFVQVDLMNEEVESLTRKPSNDEENQELFQQWNRALELYGCQENKLKKFKEKTLSLVKKCIPHELRHRVWPLIFENTLGLTNALYIELIERKSKGWVDYKVINQIEKDIARSFCGKTKYEVKTGLAIEVTQVLQLFHLYRPDVGYVQGMTYPVIMLTLVVGKLKAFRLFANIVLGNNFFRRLFIFQPLIIASVPRAFQALLEEYCNQVYRKLKDLKVESEIYLIEWLFTFFSRGLSFQKTLKFWDQLAYFGEIAVFKLGLSILELLGPRLRGIDYEQTITVIRDYWGKIDESHLIEIFLNHKLTHYRLSRAIDKAEKEYLAKEKYRQHE